MNRTSIRFGIPLIIGILIGGLGIRALDAQQTGIKRTVLMKNDLTAQGREGVMGHAEIPAGMAAGRHFHHGEEMGYVLEGEAVLEVEGKAAQTLKPGDTYFIEAGKAHDVKVIGTVAAKALAVYIVEKGKPFAVTVQ